MANRSDTEANIDLPPAFSMWKTFYNTVSMLYRNLENTENNLQSFANTILGSVHFSDIFIPCYDHSLSFEANQALEAKYKVFTTWFLGRLFYILSYEKYARIHELYIKAQLKILNILRINQPHVYNLMISEYNTALQELNYYVETTYTRPVRFVNRPVLMLNVFDSDTNVIKSKDLELSPKFIQINSVDSCINLQHNILRILTHAHKGFIDSYWMDQLSQSVLNNIVDNLKYSNLKGKIIVLEYFVELLDTNYFQIKNFQVHKYYRKIILCLESFINIFNFGIYNFHKNEVMQFENVLCKFINVAIEYKIIHNDIYLRMKYRQICEVIFQHILKKNTSSANEHRALMQTCMSLIKEVLEIEDIFYPEITFLLEYSIIKKQCTDIDILLEYQIFRELTTYARQENFRIALTVYLYQNSDTWILLYGNLITELRAVNDKTNIREVEKILQYAQDLFEIVQRVYVSFREWFYSIYPSLHCSVNVLQNTDIIHYIISVINNAKIDSSSEKMKCLDLILEIFHCILSFHGFAVNKLVHFKSMIEIILYPFKDHVTISNTHNVLCLTTDKMTAETRILKQSRSLYIVSTCLMEPTSISQKWTIMSYWLPAVYQHCLTIPDNRILCQVAKCIPYALGTSKILRKALCKILHQLLVSNNSEILKIVSELLGIIICILSGKYITVSEIHNKSIQYEVHCLTCDFIKGETNETIRSATLYHRKWDNKKCALYHFSRTESIWEIDILPEIWKLITSEIVVVRRNIAKGLARFFKHIETFNTKNVTKMWLNLITDEDKEVRINLVESVRLIVQDCQSVAHWGFLEDCLDLLKDKIGTYVLSANVGSLETSLAIIKEIGCVKNSKIIYASTKLLVCYLMLCNKHVSTVAVDCLHDIAKAHGLRPNLLYVKYKNQICRTVVGMSVISYCQRRRNFAQTLEKMSLAFYVPIKDLIARDCHHFLPYLIPLFVKIPQCKPILADIARLMSVGPADLLVSNFSYIYTHIYLNESRRTFKNCMQFVEQITKNTVSVLRRRTIKIIHNELLMHCHDKRELVMGELHALSKEDPNRPEMPITATKGEVISSYLHSRFLGVLVYFDAKLTSKNVSESAKKRVLESLPELIRVMGQRYITTVRIKVLNTLRTASTLIEEQYLELVYNCWDAFVRGCEVESLGPLLSTIYVSMLPLNPLIPQNVNAILRYLIIENEEKIKDNIQDLYVLPHTHVSADILNVIKRHVKDNQSETFREQFTVILKYINYKNLEVQIHGLKFLKQFLTENREELKKMILARDNLDPLIVELKDTLMQGCKEYDEDVRLACGECIGEIGAIEPSQFPRMFTQEDLNFPFYITEEAFVFEGLTELLRSFQVEKHTQNMNRFALAIQEILKSYGIAPNKFGPKNALWSKFSPYMQELMLPLLSSRYTISLQTDVVLTHPICTSNLGATFADWVDNWMMYLIRIMKNEKSSLLQDCRPCFKQDYRTLMYFLPRILIHSLIECTDEDRTLIYNEFLAVLTAPSGFKGLKSKSSDHRYVKSPQYIPTDLGNESNTTNQHSHVTVIFVLLDYLDRWLREYERVKYEGTQTNTPSREHYNILKTFINQFCKLRIAKCNYMRDEYPRAIMYLEEYIGRDKTKLTEQLGFLAQIYIKLDDPDGPYGVMALKETELTQEDMILRHTITGQYQDAAACYEQMAHRDKLSAKHIKNMIGCYQYLDNPYTTLVLATGEISLYNIERHKLSEIEAESYWRIGLFNKLAAMLLRLDMKTNTSWGVRIGQALLYFRESKRIEFHGELKWIRKLLIAKLSNTSFELGMYGQGYSYIIKLHILNELENAEDIVHRINSFTDEKIGVKTANELLQEWDMRMKLVQPTVSVMEAVLRFRRIILLQVLHILQPNFENIQKILNDRIGNYWLLSARIARKGNVCTQAYNYVLYAEKYLPMSLFIEKAQLCWQKLDHELAFSTLKRGIEKHFPDAATFRNMDPTERKTERQICARAKLLIATYNEETSNVDMEVNIAHYKEAVDMCREWDKSLLCLAQYYEKVFYTMEEDSRDKVGADILIHIINCFGKSLVYGTNHIYQSMPRMLSMWFDFGTRMVENKDKDSEAVQKHKLSTLLKMIRLIDTFLDILPAYMFLSAFSQLVSRICHPVREVYLQIKTILIKLIIQYPQQCMWRIMAVSKSSYAVRTKRCQEVLQDSRLKNSNVIKLIFDFNRIADKLIELCNKPLSDAIVKSSINTLVKALPRLLQSKEFSQIMLPTQKLLKLVLPNPNYNNPEYTPFPNTCVYISKIDDEITILPSLQRPRKITLTGTDGKKYIHMLKPKDDLRKDFRLMEFNDVVNNYLHLSPESRARRLCIRTYSVVPLNEECGIVEWVNNLVGLRPVLVKLYKQKDLYVGSRELKTMMCARQDSLARKRQMLVERLIPKHPPVLAEWFRQTFPDAHFWYQARNAYVRTSAVISMVGYILGLGDRHGENILFDTTNGDTVHVDFNCLFNKGEHFEWPERVPFRLTHNMVDAMGPMGVEGTFRRSCEITLRILRDHIDTLMSILRPFVYDPLVSWPRHQIAKADDDPERRNDQAVIHIRNIELRLQGMINIKGKGFSISLSPEGQANNLILDATNVDNLCQMYMGWGPFM